MITCFDFCCWCFRNPYVLSDLQVRVVNGVPPTGDYSFVKYNKVCVPHLCVLCYARIWTKLMFFFRLTYFFLNLFHFIVLFVSEIEPACLFLYCAVY